MGESNRAEDTYALGRSERETERLIEQAALFALPLQRFLQDAGIAPGMKVLELGSGASDVAIAIGHLVGPRGSVVGVDMNPVILETARRRVAAAGLDHVSFIEGDISRDNGLPADFDAVAGRLILMHLRDPVAVVRAAASQVRPGGIVAFQEGVHLVNGFSHPPSPLFDRVMAWYVEALSLSRAETSMGLKQRQTFLDAGLPEPQLRAHGPILSDQWGLGFLVATLRSALPNLVRSGAVTEEEVGIDTLEGRFRDEFARQRGIAIPGFFIDAWTRKEGSR